MHADVRFDTALPRLVQAVREAVPDVDFRDIRVVRDMQGRLFLVVPNNWDTGTISDLRQRLSAALGPYSPGEEAGAARSNDVLAGKELLAERALLVWVDDAPVHLIERRAVGQDWALPPEPSSAHPPRFVFYSLKGGVGRSTALMLWGRHLAERGQSVLLVDLDLEAPGLGAHLLPSDGRPLFGTLDWLVEDLVGNADRTPAADLIADSPLSHAPGLWVAPALGAEAARHPGNVLAKLARAYLESDEGAGFASRLNRLICALEGHLSPDVVLIDSRAGLHESVAANLLHLDAEVLLFAVDLPATWEGYRYLFGHLRQLAPDTVGGGGFDAWRARLRMIQARAAGTEAEKRRFSSSAFGVWVDTLYDEAPPDQGDAFSFDEHDEAAPHWPLTILRSERFEAFHPLEQLADVGERAIGEVFGELFAGLDERLLALKEDSE